MEDTDVQSPSDQAREILEALERSRPDVHALALLASPARKIEPELLRALRLAFADRLQPESRPHVGTESALWFSLLVESRGPDSMTLLPEISRELQDKLKEQDELFEAVHTVIEGCHGDIAPVLRWEEELVYVALSKKGTDLSRQRRIKEAARQALEAISTNARAGLEDRVREMWTRLPEPATTNTYLANLHHLCDVRALRRAGGPSEAIDGSLQSISLQVRKVGESLRIGFFDNAQVTIQVPALDPVTLDVLKSERSRRAVNTLAIHAEQSVDVPIGTGPLVLRTVDGRVYSLKRTDFEEPTVVVHDGLDEQPRLDEARLIVLGPPGEGKTSLISRLVGGPFQGNETVTHGIRITEWAVTTRDGRQIALHIWDFGGQDVVHDIYRLFLGRNGVYLIVLDREANGEPWMTYAADRPCVLVLNKSRVSVDIKAVVARYPNVVQIVQTDASENRRIEELRSAVGTAVGNLPVVHQPRSWAVVGRRLRERPDNFVTESEFRQMCAEEGLSEAGDQDAFAASRHDLGMLLHFPDDPRLRDTYVLKPEWLANGIMQIVLSPRRQGARGELTHGDIRGILRPEVYPDDRLDFILGVMELAELCFPFPGRSAVLVPELLDPTATGFDSSFRPADSLNLRLSYDNWPSSLLPRFMVRMDRYNGNLSRWRAGVILDSEGNSALVQGDSQQKTINVSVQGPVGTRKRFMDLIRSNFDELHKRLPALTVAVSVPLPHNPSISIPYDQLERDFARGITTVNVREDGSTVNIAEVLGVPATSERNQPAKVFISYAHKDEALCQELRVHLNTLRRQGLMEIFWAEEPSIAVGEHWEEELNKNLQNAELVLLLLSADFLNSEYCYREMQLALQFRESQKTILIPVVLRPCDWTHTPLGSIQSLPEKPVTKYENRDEAWLKVAEGIRQVLLKRRNPSPPPVFA